MKFTLNFLFILSTLFLLNSCVGIKNIQAPTVDGIKDFKMGAPKDGKLPFSFTTPLKNPDRLKFHIKRADLEFVVAGVRIAEIKTTKKMKIRRQLEPELKWEATAELALLLKNPTALLGSIIKQKPVLDVSGTITVGKLFWKKTLPIQMKLPVEIPFK